MRCIFMFQKQNISKLPYSISQNFLTNRRLIERLIKKAGITKQDIVLEIGAGKGHITKALGDSCKRVIAYEIDSRLYEKLKPQIAKNICLYHGDFLKYSLPKTTYKVFANIPFSKTTAILNKLTNAKPLPTGIWLVMEKGAAMRFCGQASGNLHSLLLRPFFQSRIIHSFRREDFHPIPRVDIVMVEFKRKEMSDIRETQRADFAAFLSHSLRYGLFGHHALLTKKQIATALRFAGLPPIRPSGEVLYIQWLCLFRCWLQYSRKER